MNKKPVITILLILLLPFSAAEYFGGSGTSNDPYEIATCDHLQNMDQNPSDHFELITNVDCSETSSWNGGDGFEPISGFSGNIDGQNQDIRGLTIDRSGSSDIGMFSSAGSFHVENLRLVEFDIHGNSRVGTLTGTYNSDAYVENLGVIDSSVEGDSIYVGGIAGDDDHSEGIDFRNSYVQDTNVTGGSDYVGGFDSRSGSSATIEESQIVGGYIRGDDQVGGLIGRSSSSSGVVDSYTGTTVIGTGSGRVGGMLGYTSTAGSTFSQLYSYSTVENGEGMFGDGGDGGDSINDAYFDYEEAGTTSDGWDGQPLETDEMTGEDAPDNMENFDFQNIWETTDEYPQLQGIIFGTRDPEFSQTGDDRYPEDGTTITEGFVDMGITVSHPDDQDMNVIFRDEERGELATLRVDSGQVSGSSSYTVETRISGLQDGDEYNWDVLVCDGNDDCVEAETWEFDVDYSGVLGMRDKDYHPQGANIELDEEDPLYEGHIVRVNDNSSQLQPGMDNTFFNMDGQGSDPNRLHLYATFIDNPANIDGADGDHPLWYDSLSQADRADQYAIAENPTWSIGPTGNPYPPGDPASDDNNFEGETTDLGTYIHPGVTDIRELRTSPEDETLEKPAVVMGNSYAAVAAQDFDGHQEGDGVWIDPDNIKRYDEYYMGDWEDKLHFEMDLTGPDAGLGFDSDIYRPNFDENNPIPDGTYYYPSTQYEENSIVVGDIYWQRENELDGEPTSETHGYLNPDMCGDDQSEYLVEEIGAINNSLRFNGSYACAETNQVCYDSGPAADEQNIFEQGAYHDTRDWTEYVGRLHNDQEKCERVEYDEFDPVAPYGDDIQNLQDDRFPGWYDQDFAEEIDGRQLCRENSFYDDRGKRWIDEDYVANHPLSVYNGINDDWNQYLEQKWGDTLTPIESRTNQLDQFTGGSSWVDDKISPVDTGTNRSYQATLGFCLGDDDGEYLLTQQSETPHIPNNNDFKGAGSNPDQCVLDGQDLLQSRDDINEIRSEDIHETINDENVAEEERIVYNEGDIVVLDFGGSEAEVACFEGNWFSDWPIVFEEDLVQVPFEDDRTTAFTLVNPTGQDIIYDVEMETSTDSSVTGAGLDSFTELVSEEGTEFNTTIESQDSRTFRINVRGGNEDIDQSEDTYISVSARDQAGDIEGEDSVQVEVTDTVREEGAGRAQEVPGISPLHILIVMMASIMVFYKNQ